MTAISPYASLEPCMWRRLLVQAAVFHANRRTLGRLCELADQFTAVAVVLQQLQMHARAVTDEDDDATALARVVDAWDDDLSRMLAMRPLEADALRLLADIRAGLAQVCGTDPFRAMFEAVALQARALYGTAWPPVDLSLLHIGSHPRSADDPYAVTAMTFSHLGKAEVELHIFQDRFGPAAYAAVPMLLTHECVCHVAARQDRVKNASTFAEGLLDWAAYYFLELWAVKLDRESGPTLRKHAEELRTVLTAQKTTAERAARRLGHDAARELIAWFENECGMSLDECEKRVARLAVELNLVDRPLADKDHLVSMLAGGTPPPDMAISLHLWADGLLTSHELLGAATASVP